MIRYMLDAIDGSVRNLAYADMGYSYRVRQTRRSSKFVDKHDSLRQTLLVVKGREEDC